MYNAFLGAGGAHKSWVTLYARQHLSGISVVYTWFVGSRIHLSEISIIFWIFSERSASEIVLNVHHFKESICRQHICWSLLFTLNKRAARKPSFSGIWHLCPTSLYFYAYCVVLVKTAVLIVTQSNKACSEIPTCCCSTFSLFTTSSSPVHSQLCVVHRSACLQLDVITK